MCPAIFQISRKTPVPPVHVFQKPLETSTGYQLSKKDGSFKNVTSHQTRPVPLWGFFAILVIINCVFIAFEVQESRLVSDLVMVEVVELLWHDGNMLAVSYASRLRRVFGMISRRQSFWWSLRHLQAKLYKCFTSQLTTVDCWSFVRQFYTFFGRFVSTHPTTGRVQQSPRYTFTTMYTIELSLRFAALGCSFVASNAMCAFHKILMTWHDPFTTFEEIQFNNTNTMQYQ